jgi:glucose uptake protein
MASVIFAIVTVLCWGTWLAPSQNVPLKGQQIRTFYVTLAALLLAVLVALVGGVGTLTAASFWLPFLGGLIWAASGWSAFVATDRLGMAKAMGIWAPMNILVSIAWGMLLFGEFLKPGSASLASALAAVVVIIAGILFIIFSGGEASGNSRFSWVGLAGAVGAGIGWGSYFIPIRISALSMWVAMLPVALGMFVGSCLLVVVSRLSVKLDSPSHYPRLLATGLLWGIGNYGALKMMELIGTGKGFTIAQVCVVVNALVGVFVMKNPKPGSRAAVLTLIGVAIATIGAIVLGTLKS